jgi:hypothetical protein
MATQVRVLLNSIPKAGAHLAVKALQTVGLSQGARSIGSAAVLGRRQLLKQLLRGSWTTGDAVVVGIEVPAPVRASWVRRRLAQVATGQFLRGHVRYSEHFAHLLAELGFRILHVVRDPRDVAVSHAHYMMDRPRHPLHRHYRSLDGWEARLSFSITGGRVPGVGYLNSLARRYRLMAGWRCVPGVVTLRFEDLVGVNGGGSEARQRAAVAALTEVGKVRDEGAVDRVVETLFGGTSTFRRGRIGGWRESFGPEHHELIRTHCSGVLEEWGYAE